VHHPTENFIHPTAILEGDVRIGVGNYIGPFAYISGPVVIGDNNWIGSNVRIGAIPEVKLINHFESATSSDGFGVRIGDNAVIREAAQIHQGWKRETFIGSGSFIMNQVYIAHDCSIGENSTIASSVLLAGNVTLGVMANLGLGTTVHQGRNIGPLAMVGMASVITRDIPAFSKCFGSPAKVEGVNRIGMQRAGVASEQIEAVSKFLSNQSKCEETIESMVKALPASLCQQFGIC
jgi:UDP-N-acetylglucosamine acyltransferase